MTEIRINAPGAGAWIMQRAGGYFTPVYENSFSAHRDGEIVGGFVVAAYLGHSAMIHMAGEGRDWCVRDLLWMVFDYTFNQLGIHKVIAAVRSDNYGSLSVCLRGGWQIETLVRDLFADGVHCFLLQMTRDTCPWLKLKPQAWKATRDPIVFSQREVA